MHLDLPTLRRRLQRSAKRLGDVTLEDLVAPDPKASNGLYAFFLDQDVCYVGCARSRALIERVASHLDMREEAWFGTLLERLARRKGGRVKRWEIVGEALDARVAVIFKNVARGDLGTAERALRHAFRPTFNAPKRAKALTGTLATLARRGAW